MMVLLAFIVSAQAAQPAPIKVSSAQDVLEIRKLNGFVTAFSKSVTACVDAGRPIATCQCRYPQQALVISIPTLRRELDGLKCE